MRLYWSRVALMQSDWCPYKKQREILRETQEEEAHVMMEAEMGVMQLQAKDCRTNGRC